MGFAAEIIHFSVKISKKCGVNQNPPKKKLWMVIELEDIRKYEIPVKPKRFVPVGGQYLRE